MRTLRVGMVAVALAGATASAAFAQGRAADGPKLTVETVARGLEYPWGMAFLPDGILVTERPGRLRIVGRDGKISSPLAGVPKVFAVGQGGLHDIILDRDFAQNRTVYFCFAEAASGGGRTSMARAQLVRDGAPRLDDVEVVFRQEGPLSRGNHFGCRIVQMPDGALMLTLGDHYTARDQAQNLANHIGKIVRVMPDGSVPRDNPFVGRGGTRPEIWSYGHRNSQGAALHPTSGKLWMHEHGARGGDEVNIPEAGKNYGWPVITHGVDYSGAKIGIGNAKEGMEQPVWQWTPSIAPSGMAFYTGDLFPEWKGSLLVGALAGQLLSRLVLDGDKVVREERLLRDQRIRIRDVRQGPDGAVWLLTDAPDGALLRVTPAR